MSSQPTISDILQRHFEKRQAKNAGYSVRAYSRDLELSPAFLSQILSKKRSLSPAKAELISQKLKLSRDDHDYLIAQSIITSSRSEIRKQQATAKVDELMSAEEAQALSKEEFTMISEWYHLAIFQCLFLKSHIERSFAVGEVTYLAQFLKILPEQVEDALARLLKLNIIACENSVHLPLKNYLTVKSKLPSAAIRKFHRQTIQKSLIAMEAQPVNERFFHSTQLTISKTDLPEMARECQQFYQSLMKKFAKKATAEIEADSVYAFSTQLFSLTHVLEKKS